MSDKTGRTLVYSNRPPTAGPSGGAHVVIDAAKPTWWIGPEAVGDREWDATPAQIRENRFLHDTDFSYDVETFYTPKTLEEAQYKTISNEILWPIAHSMQPNCSETAEQIEAAYHQGYLSHNDLGNVALRQAAQDNAMTADDKIWIHDYQCANVPGMIFSSHIPWPSVDFLETVSFKSEAGSDVALLDTSFYRDFVEVMNNHALLTFQRPVDQANFLMTTARIAGEGQFTYASENPALQNIAADVKDPAKREAIQAALLDEIKLGTVSEFSAFGVNTSLMNVPVGQITTDTLKDAIANEKTLDKTTFSRKEDGTMPIFNASIGGGKTANLTATNPADFEGRSPTLNELIEPIRGRDWIYSIHRNDYTKGTLTKLEAAEEILAEQPNATFLFILQPTREDVAGYKEYAEQVFSKANELRQKFGEKSVVVIPEAVKHDDAKAILRQPEVKAFLSLGHKDGHDLTVREAVDANDAGKAIGIVVSSGIGACDVLCDGEKGGFRIENPTDGREVAAALRDIMKPENAASLSERFDFMKARSQQFDAKNFSTSIEAAYEPAMAHRFGAEWKQGFQHPDGGMIDRKSQHQPQETERPAFLKQILESKFGTADSPPHNRTAYTR